MFVVEGQQNLVPAVVEQQSQRNIGRNNSVSPIELQLLGDRVTKLLPFGTDLKTQKQEIDLSKKGFSLALNRHLKITKESLEVLINSALHLSKLNFLLKNEFSKSFKYLPSAVTGGIPCWA